MIRIVFLTLAISATVIGFHLLTIESENIRIVSTKTPNERHSPIARQTSLHPAQVAAKPMQNIPATLNTHQQGLNTAPIATSYTLPVETNQYPWAENKNPPAMPERYYNKGITAIPMKLDQQQISSLRKGDEMSFPIPQTNQAYQMQVEQVSRHKNGDRSLKGHLVDTSIPYSVTVTEGSNSLYATINTPDGSYLMEADGENGWIMSLAELDNLIDPTMDDFMIPPL
ncbi:MAG: hypothetical protein KUG79_03510 [Pseudomonadales bacterium]|nr:hypothetical protein [Pseudomonadales bacterium]